VGAQGIAAETPQDLQGKSEELERKARFFTGWGFAKQIPEP
jgi:hypothetical protein